MTFYLDETLKPFFSRDTPLFDQVMNLKGERFRDQEGRLTQRVKLGGKYYFIKQHRGVGWREIFKNLVQGRLPVTSAKNEWRAIQRLQKLGVAVPVISGYGGRGVNPARKESFILMEELTPVMSLETLCKPWNKQLPAFVFKKYLIEEVARISRILHENGINHRDFYLCHFLIDAAAPLSKHPPLYLIDLHRAQIREKTPARWRIKDLAGLYFSSKDAGLTLRDWYRFTRAYRQKSLRDFLKKETKFWEQILARGEQLYRGHFK